VSPLTVKYILYKESVLKFLISVCAVVGGVFTVATMLDGIIFSCHEYYKKVVLGKIKWKSSDGWFYKPSAKPFLWLHNDQK